MENVIIRNILVVGMQHLGSHEIPIDNCAVAIGLTRTVAYVRLEDSCVNYSETS